MKNYIITGILILFATLTFAQKSEERKIDSFDKIDVFGNIEVVMSLGDTETLRIETKNIDPSEVSTQVKENLLKIKMSSNLFDDDVKVKVFVTYKVIREISSNASAAVKFNNPVTGDKVVINATSGGRVVLKADLNAVELNAYQGAQVDISGKTKLLEAYVNTGGILAGSDFTADEAYMKMNTGGKAEIIVNKRIEAHVNTGANFSYFGKPEKEDLNTTLGGKITSWDKE